jgi:hypothetical protein
VKDAYGRRNCLKGEQLKNLLTKQAVKDSTDKEEAFINKDEGDVLYLPALI